MSLSLSLYNASIPVFIRGLKQLAFVLEKGESHARSAGLGPDALFEAKLAPDMSTLAGQVQTATDIARAAAAKLCGEVQPAAAMAAAKTYADLKPRIASTLAFLESVDRANIEGTEDRPITVTLPDRKLNYPAYRYVQEFALPNFYFHICTAYCVLRSQGVPLQKLDFLGKI